MNGWTPGDGWREVDAAYGQEYIAYGGGEKTRYWVREVPVPPLPTEPYTVIRVHWKAGAVQLADRELTLHKGVWRDTSDGGYTSEHLIGRITGFEVLSEPRAATAKAVLDRVRDAVPHGGVETMEAPLERIAREFGVTS